MDKNAIKSLAAFVVTMFALAGANLAYGKPYAMIQAFEYGHLPGSQPGEPTIWSVEQVVGSGEWEFDRAGDYQTSPGCRSGSKNARIVHTANGNKTKLISPVVDLSGYADAQLHFWFINRAWGSDIDKLTIYYRTSSSAAWTKLQEISDAHAAWTRCDVPLPNLSSTYQVAFEHYDNYGYGVGIDDVEIGPALNTWTDGDGVTWTYYVDKDDGRAKIYNGTRFPAIDNPTTRTSVTVPAKLNGYDADIGEYAFYGCTALTSIMIEDGVTSIGNYAFYGCTALANATIPASVISVDDWVFRNSSSDPSKNTPFWNNLPDGLVVLGSVAYRVKGTCPAVVNIPDGVKVLGHQAFWQCDTLNEVTIPSSVESWEYSVFYGCAALTSVTIEEGVMEIGAHAFDGCDALTSVTIPGSVKSIGDNAFYDCDALTSVTLGHGVTSLGLRTFYSCDALSEVTIPASVTSIGNDVFDFCKNLSTIYVEAGDAERVRSMVEGSGYTGDVTYIESNPDPESLDPFYPGELPCYNVLNPADIWDPIRAPKAVTLKGALYYGCDVVGIVELKVGKPSKDMYAKVSGTVILLDGKKYTIKSQKCYFGGSLATTLNLEVKGGGNLRIAIGSIGGVNVFSGELGKWHVQTANVGEDWGKATATVNVDISDSLDSLPSGILAELLPTNEVANVAGGKWKFEKAASVKWTKLKDGVVPLVKDEESGKGLVVDTSKGKTNLSGLKLTYTPKKSTFKGSFKLYELKGSGKSTKLNKFTVNISGVVVNGVGYGTATCKKPVISCPVVVE